MIYKVRSLLIFGTKSVKTVSGMSGRKVQHIARTDKKCLALPRADKIRGLYLLLKTSITSSRIREINYCKNNSVFFDRELGYGLVKTLQTDFHQKMHVCMY